MPVMFIESDNKIYTHMIRQKSVKEKIHMDDESTSVAIAHLVQLALHESKGNLNGTWEELSENLWPPEVLGLTISAELLRKYASGVQSVSRSRALYIFNSIANADLAGPITFKAIEQLSKEFSKGFGLLPLDQVEMMSAELAKLRYASSRSKKDAVENLRKALHQLSDFVWNRHELEYVALAAIQEISRYEGSGDTCGGGLLTPRSLPIFRKQDGCHELAVLNWSVSSYLDSSTPD